ncbi:MAG TPA: DUF1810 family protein [Polyangiaceae bacterium]
MSPSGLERFHTAQAEAEHGYAAALAEIQTTGKQTHWIWYVFPQLAELGHSPEARRYGIAGRAEAKAYLLDPLLRSRLLEIATAVGERLDQDWSLSKIMGSPIDVLKLVSSLTLFEHISRELQAEEENAELAALATIAERVLTAAAREDYARCALTTAALASK